MKYEDHTLLELTKSIQSLSDNLVMMEVVIIASGGSAAVLLWIFIKYYERMIETKFDNNADTFDIAKAERLDDVGDIEGLLGYCMPFLEMCPNDANVSFYIGLAHYRQSMYIEAKQYFTECARLNPNLRNSVAAYLEVIEEELTIPHNGLKN